MAHYFLIFWWLLSLLGQFNTSRTLIELFELFLFNSKNNKSKYIGYSRFLLQLQVQMKTSLEVMNMNHLRSSITAHCWLSKKRNAIVIRRYILSITHLHFLVEFSLKYIIKHSNIFKWIQNKSSSASKRNVNKCKQCSPFAVKLNNKICYWF